MAFQVLARKWRPQRFDDVVGQQAVTRTLRNALSSGRIAQAFVFAGSRGCGKTTTARILARALNCVQGPTPDPCGQCDACVEIAQGRDIDVLEIDAASHTQVENIRDVILSGLSVAPVRDRYKIFIIDEVHQLSSHSFNALLKSIEEPPAHVVFMMATTELHKIPDTILSRSQVFEFRSISTKAITEQLRRIADAETIEVPDSALTLIARSAEGSMRDAQSALDQVLAFAGRTIALDDVSTVLGLVGRDLLLDLVEAVVDEDAPKAFTLADRAVESGHDLRLVLRELTRVVRDLMILSVDPSRTGDGEIAGDERERLMTLAKRFSREDMMRAFDLLAKAEQEIRTASHPRYHFEMALLRWMHLRKLVPLADLLAGGGAGGTATAPRAAAPRGVSGSPAPTRAATAAAAASRTRPPTAAPTASTGPGAAVGRTQATAARAPAASPAAPTEPVSAGDAGRAGPALKDAFLAEIRGAKAFFYNTVVAQAQKIEVLNDAVTFTFLPAHRVLREQFEQARSWLEPIAERLAGRRLLVTAVQTAAAPVVEAPAPVDAPVAEAAPRRDLKAEAMSSSAVQAMLDVFPAEIRDVEEM